MNWFLAVVIFITSWFILFFILLPIGLVREDNPIPGQALSAPKKVFWLRKIAFNTVLSLLATAVLLALIDTPAQAKESPLNKPPSTKSEIVYPPARPGKPTPIHVVPCRDRVPHVPNADVHFQPGMGVNGAAVVSPDLGGSAAATADLENPIIPLYALLTGQPVLPGQPNTATGYEPQTFADFGAIEIVNGQALLNGQPLTPPDACPE